MQGRRVLIVDDEENVLQSLQRALMDEDYCIETACDAQEAQEKLSLFPPDIVISDNIMPGMTGLELLQRVKQQYPDSIRILLTGQSETPLTIGAINSGDIFRYLLKPWNDDELKITLRMALRIAICFWRTKGLPLRLKNSPPCWRNWRDKIPALPKCIGNRMEALSLKTKTLMI